jgi:hypothetical protein
MKHGVIFVAVQTSCLFPSACFSRPPTSQPLHDPLPAQYPTLTPGERGNTGWWCKSEKQKNERYGERTRKKMRRGNCLPGVRVRAPRLLSLAPPAGRRVAAGPPPWRQHRPQHRLATSAVNRAAPSCALALPPPSHSLRLPPRCSAFGGPCASPYILRGVTVEKWDGGGAPGN